MLNVTEDVVVGVSLTGFLSIWTLKSTIDSKVTFISLRDVPFDI